MKKQTGLYISGECLSQLSQEIARVKAAKAEPTPDAAAVPDDSTPGAADEQPKPKARRRPRTKKNEETAAVPE